jgi:hypothetical protein
MKKRTGLFEEEAVVQEEPVGSDSRFAARRMFCVQCSEFSLLCSHQWSPRFMLFPLIRQGLNLWLMASKCA